MGFDPEERKVREPIAEGVFYPAEATQLEDEIRSRLRNSTIIADRARAIIAPYASYAYCGVHLASAYKACAARQTERVFVLGPCHRDPGPGVYVPESIGFRIPTGVVEVDAEAVARAAAAGAYIDDMPHLDEHSIEVQLPFIHYLFPRARIVPILVGRSSAAPVEMLAKVLGAAAGGVGDLLVIAANVSGSQDRKDARKEAGVVLDSVLECDWTALESASRAGEVSAAGIGCVAAALRYLGCSEGWEIISQGDSYSIDGDPSNCVEYAAVALGREDSGDR